MNDSFGGKFKVVKRARQMSPKNGCGRCSSDVDQPWPVAKLAGDDYYDISFLNVAKEQHKG